MVRRQLPGGTGLATGIYSRIAPEREQIAFDILEFMTSDGMVAVRNAITSDAVSTNINVQPSADPLAVRYAEVSAPNQFVYLDWYWPRKSHAPSRKQQQGIVAKTVTASEAAENIQSVLDELYAEGYEFEF